jgi:two-component system chemotaxis sensor kinase CheA
VPSTEPAPDEVESAGEHVDAEEADADVEPGVRETEAPAGGDTDTETEPMEGVEAGGDAIGPIEAPAEPERADEIEETASEADSTEAAPETDSPATTESAESAEASETPDPGEASDPSEPDAPAEEPVPASDTTDEGVRASGDAAEFTPDIEFDTGDEVTFEEDYEEFEDVSSSGSVPGSSSMESGSSSARSESPSVEETTPSTAPDVESDFGDSDDFAPDVDFGTDVDVSSSMSSEMPAEPPATDSSDEPADGTEAVEAESADASEGSADATGSGSAVSTDASIEEEFPETVDADLDSVDFESVDATVEFGPDPSQGETPEEPSADDREDVDEELDDVEVGEFDVDEPTDAAGIDVDADDLTAEIEAADEAFADLDLEDSSGDPDFDGLDRDFGMGASAGMRSDAESGTAGSDEGGRADGPGLPVEIVSEPEELPDRDVDLDELLPTPPQELTGADGEEADETQSIRVDIDRIDELLNLVEGLVTTRARLRRSVESGESLTAIDQEVDDLEDLVGELQDTVMDVRLVPLSTVANRLPRTVRDIARDQDKQVSFEMEGGDVEVDRSILDDIDDPLMHLVRNAVDHGIEPPEEREAIDKDPTGTVTLSARRRRDQVVIEVQDDGRGLDPDRLREEAVDQGLLSNEEAQDLSDEQTYELVFESGFSTTADVTDVSGRGVGMDVVSTTVEELGGTVTIDSEPGEGTTVSMTLPVTVAISDVMFVRSGEEEFGVPLKAVEEVDGMGRVETVDGEECLVDGEDTYPLVRLAETLETGGITRDGDGKLVKLRKDVRRIAIHCDEVRGQQEVVVRPFEGVLGDIPGLSGATVLGEGDVVNILDVNTL